MAPRMDANEHADFLEWRRTTVDGRKAEYGIAGEGPLVVFLHGWALSNRTYKSPLKRLVHNGYRVIAPALPGLGGSAALAETTPDIEAYSEWVATLLDDIAPDQPAVVIGHSFGGGVSIRLAYDHPERVQALVLINSIGGSAWREDGGIVRTLKERPLWDWGLHFPSDLRPTRQMTRVLPVIVRDAIGNALRNPAAVWRSANVARFADLREELEELKERQLPVIVLWGDADEIVGRMAIDSLVDTVGAHEVQTLPGGHSWLLADPEAFGEIVTNVLTLAQRSREAN